MPGPVMSEKAILSTEREFESSKYSQLLDDHIIHAFYLTSSIM